MEKATEQGVQSILKQISVLRQRRSRIENFRALADRPEWRDLRDALLDYKEQHVKAIDNYVEYRVDLEPVEIVSSIRRHQGCRDAFQSVLNQVERPQEEIDRINIRLEDLERELSSKQQELETFK